MTGDAPALRGFTEMAAPFFAEAEKRRLPIFVTPVAESNPLNASPYLLSYEQFKASAAAWPGRAPLVDALDVVKRGAESAGVVVEALLIGGSFTELAKPQPRDIDCLMFYRLKDETAMRASDLGRLRSLGRHEGVDVRFIPLDGDPLVLIKSVSYFTILYSKLKQEEKIATEALLVRALLLVDCTDQEFSPSASDAEGKVSPD